MTFYNFQVGQTDGRTDRQADLKGDRKKTQQIIFCFPYILAPDIWIFKILVSTKILLSPQLTLAEIFHRMCHITM